MIFVFVQLQMNMYLVDTLGPHSSGRGWEGSSLNLPHSWASQYVVGLNLHFPQDLVFPLERLLKTGENPRLQEHMALNLRFTPAPHFSGRGWTGSRRIPFHDSFNHSFFSIYNRY